MTCSRVYTHFDDYVLLISPFILSDTKIDNSRHVYVELHTIIEYAIIMQVNYNDKFALRILKYQIIAPRRYF